MHVRRLQVPQSWKDRLLAVNVTDVGQIVIASELELMEILDLPPSSVLELLRAATNAICPPAVSAASLYSRPNTLSLSLLCPPLLLDPRDPLAHACLPAALSIDNSGGITELLGPHGSGKTQALLSLAARCALPQDRGGLGAPVVFVQLGPAQGFSSLRLLQILKEEAFAHRPLITTSVTTTTNATIAATAVASASAFSTPGVAAAVDAETEADVQAAQTAAAAVAETAASRVLVLTATTVPAMRSLILPHAPASTTTAGSAQGLDPAACSLEDVVSESGARLVLIDGLPDLLADAGLAPGGLTSHGGFTSGGSGYSSGGGVALQRQQLLGSMGAALKAVAAGYEVGVMVANRGPPGGYGRASGFAKTGLGTGIGTSTGAGSEAGVGGGGGLYGRRQIKGAGDEQDQGPGQRLDVHDRARARARARAHNVLGLGPGAADAVYGVGWTHAVTTRIVLSAAATAPTPTHAHAPAVLGHGHGATTAAAGGFGEGTGGGAKEWLATVAKSPAHARLACPYVIGPRGLHAFADAPDLAVAPAQGGMGEGEELGSLWGGGHSQFI